MIRSTLAALTVALLPLNALAHFVYIVPAKESRAVKIVFSDDLEPDVEVGKIKSLKLSTEQGAEVKPTVEKSEMNATVPEGAKCVHGTVAYGLMSRAGTKPSLLVYHPKAILSPVTSQPLAANAKALLEVVPELVSPGKVRFRVYAQGKPVANAEGSLMLPDDEKAKLKTDAEGYTEAFAQPGRYALWVRHTEAKTGTHDSKPYEEIKHYATLVVDVAK